MTFPADQSAGLLVPHPRIRIVYPNDLEVAVENAERVADTVKDHVQKPFRPEQSFLASFAPGNVANDAYPASILKHGDRSFLIIGTAVLPRREQFSAPSAPFLQQWFNSGPDPLILPVPVSNPA